MGVCIKCSFANHIVCPIQPNSILLQVMTHNKNCCMTFSTDLIRNYRFVWNVFFTWILNETMGKNNFWFEYDAHTTEILSRMLIDEGIGEKINCGW